MSKSAKNILFSSQKEKLISHSLFLSGKDFNRITIPVFQRLFPQNLSIAFQHLRNRYYLSMKRFTKSMVLKLHLKGTSTGIVDDRRYLFKQGTAMLIFPFQPHWIMQVGTGKENDSQERLLFVFDLTSEEQKMLLPLKDRIIQLTEADYSLMLDIAGHLQKGDPVEQAVCPYLLNQFILSCLFRISMREQPAVAESSLVQTIFRFIRQQYMKNPTVSEMADALKIGETKLRSLIRKELGVSPGQLIRSLRLKEAAELLCFTDRKINDISRQCGFPNPFTFSRSFRNEYSISPRQFRTRNKTGR